MICRHATIYACSEVYRFNHRGDTCFYHCSSDYEIRQWDSQQHRMRAWLPSLFHVADQPTLPIRLHIGHSAGWQRNSIIMSLARTLILSFTASSDVRPTVISVTYDERIILGLHGRLYKQHIYYCTIHIQLITWGWLTWWSCISCLKLASKFTLFRWHQINNKKAVLVYRTPREAKAACPIQVTGCESLITVSGTNIWRSE